MWCYFLAAPKSRPLSLNVTKTLSGFRSRKTTWDRTVAGKAAKHSGSDPPKKTKMEPENVLLLKASNFKCIVSFPGCNTFLQEVVVGV